MNAIFKLIGPDEIVTTEEEVSEIGTDDVTFHGKTATIEWPHSSPDELIEARRELIPQPQRRNRMTAAGE
jgi:hypothetical protein